MGKWIERVRDWTDRQDGRLRAWLEALPQRTKLAAVLVIFTVFAVCALFTFGAAALPDGGGNGRRIEIEHIRELTCGKGRTVSTFTSITIMEQNKNPTASPKAGKPETAAHGGAAAEASKMLVYPLLWDCFFSARCG